MQYKVGIQEKHRELREAIASLRGSEVEEVKVEAGDRWEAIIEASKVWNLRGRVKAIVLAEACYVRKAYKAPRTPGDLASPLKAIGLKDLLKE